MAVCANRIKIKKARNDWDERTKEILDSLEASQSAPRLCLRCSNPLKYAGDAMFCGDCKSSAEFQQMLKQPSEMKQVRLNQVLEKRKNLISKIQCFSNKTYLEISQERNISLKEAIVLVNILIKAGHLRPNSKGEFRKGYIVFEIPEFDELLFVS